MRVPVTDLNMHGNQQILMIPEMNKISDVAFGTMETVKLMPGYKKALEELVEKHNKAKEKIEEKKFELDVE